MSRLPEDVRSVVRHFAYYLANETVAVELLDGIDYRPELLDDPSAFERVFAIFMNVLDVDESGRVTNADQAQRRAAQWIRQYHDPAYQVQPSFEEWEVELV